MTKLCPECGASLKPEQGCLELFHSLLAKDFSGPDFFAVHHLVVPSYTLQHPSRLSEEGWHTMRFTLEELLDTKNPAEVRERLSHSLSSTVRDFSLHKGNSKSLELAWSITAADVRLETAAIYGEDVRRWATSVLRDLQNAGV